MSTAKGLAVTMCVLFAVWHSCSVVVPLCRLVCVCCLVVYLKTELVGFYKQKRLFISLIRPARVDSQLPKGLLLTTCAGFLRAVVLVLCRAGVVPPCHRAVRRDIVPRVLMLLSCRRRAAAVVPACRRGVVVLPPLCCHTVPPRATVVPSCRLVVVLQCRRVLSCCCSAVLPED